MFLREDARISVNVGISNGEFQGINRGIYVFLTRDLVQVDVTSRQLNGHAIHENVALIFLLHMNVVRATSYARIRMVNGFVFRQYVRRMTIFRLEARVTMDRPMEILRDRARITQYPQLRVMTRLNVVTFRVHFLLGVLSTQVRVDSRGKIRVHAMKRRIIMVLARMTNERIRNRLVIRRLNNVSRRNVMTIMFIIKRSALNVSHQAKRVHLILIVSRERVGEINGDNSNVRRINQVV